LPKLFRGRLEERSCDRRLVLRERMYRETQKTANYSKLCDSSGRWTIVVSLRTRAGRLPWRSSTMLELQ
jgi:hypothetical protein